LAVAGTKEDPVFDANGVEHWGQWAKEAAEAFGDGEGESSPGVQDLGAVAKEAFGNLLVEVGPEQGAEEILIAPKVGRFLFDLFRSALEVHGVCEQGLPVLELPPPMVASTPLAMLKSPPATVE
jgi:hypothetical protein